VTSSGGVTTSGGVTASGGATKAGGSTATGGSMGGTTSSGGTGAGGSTAGLPAAADVLAIMKKVIPYEIALPIEDSSWTNKWTEATFYIGVMAAYLVTNDSTYLADATSRATTNKWTLIDSPTRSANSQCFGQVYEDIYLANPSGATANMYASTKASIDVMVASPKPGIASSDDWWWCDALFMAPGAVSRLGKITGNANYFSFLDTMWSATQKGLFDSKTGLFWRDSSYVNGTVYWSRGNGWVMGGIVRVLQYLPATDASYNSYVTLLKTMAAALVPYQQSDGTWHADITHPTRGTMSNPEVSGTGLMTYAIAYGINQGLLDRSTYLPVVVAAWKGLTSCVNAQGLVGYIQATGQEPAGAAATETHDYGVGAFLLAASEIYNMVK
jgi:rhamnogalacturonyl hydrolase YesR